MAVKEEDSYYKFKIQLFCNNFAQNTILDKNPKINIF